MVIVCYSSYYIRQGCDGAGCGLIGGGLLLLEVRRLSVGVTAAAFVAQCSNSSSSVTEWSVRHFLRVGTSCVWALGWTIALGRVVEVGWCVGGCGGWIRVAVGTSYAVVCFRRLRVGSA